MKVATALTSLPKFLHAPDPNIYTTGTYLVLDFETTVTEIWGTDKKTGKPKIIDRDPAALVAENSLLLACWYDSRDGTWHECVGNEFQMGGLLDAIEGVDFIVCHHTKFELQWLKRCGLDISKVLVFDTQIADYVRRGNRVQWRLDLNSCAARYGLPAKENVVSRLIKSGVCPSNIPMHWLAPYCLRDVDITAQLYLKQLALLIDEGLLNVFYSRCLFTPVLADIEANGMCLDKEFVIKAYNDLAYKHAEAKREIDEFTGGINPRSSKQVAELLYDKLGFPVPKIRGEEKRTTNAKVIGKLKAKTKKQQKFLDLKAAFAKVDAAMTKTILPMYNCVMETEDGVIYFNLNQTVTRTHRLSSTGKRYKMQGQNFPRIYKCLFTARHEGWDVGEADSGQLEFRTAVLLAQDKQGFEDIENNIDVHCLTASIIYAEEYAEVQEELGQEDLSHGQLKKSTLGDFIRQESKPNTFKPLYGGQSGTEREMAYYEAFRKKYKGITKTQEGWIDEVLTHKQLRTITGLIFYWPDTKLHKSGYVSNREAICNYPVQMFATADIMPIAIRYLWQLMHILKLQSFMCNTIHDSAINEIHPDEKEVWKEIAELSFNHLVVDYMEEMYGIDFNMPLEVEVKVKDHWSYHPKKLFPEEKSD